MKAYSLELRKRIVKEVKMGASAEGVAERFDVSLRSVYRYVEAEREGWLEPRKSWGGWRKLEPAKVREAVARRPDATLEELGKELGVCGVGVWHALGRLGITRKKKRPSTRRGARCSAGSTAGSSRG